MFSTNCYFKVCKCQINWEISSFFCGFLSKPELYWYWRICQKMTKLNYDVTVMYFNWIIRYVLILKQQYVWIFFLNIIFFQNDNTNWPKQAWMSILMIKFVLNNEKQYDVGFRAFYAPQHPNLVFSRSEIWSILL